MFVKELTTKDHMKLFTVEKFCQEDSYKASVLALYETTKIYLELYCPFPDLDDGKLFTVRHVDKHIIVTELFLSDETEIKPYIPEPEERRSCGIIWKKNPDTKLWEVAGEY